MLPLWRGCEGRLTLSRFCAPLPNPLGWLLLGRLKVAMAEAFMPWELANATKQGAHQSWQRGLSQNAPYSGPSIQKQRKGPLSEPGPEHFGVENQSRACWPRGGSPRSFLPDWEKNSRISSTFAFPGDLEHCQAHSRCLINPE